MASPGIQRTYSAPCPGCGAPVEFRSAQSSHAICGYCQSVVVRNGETLARVGKMAELFDDFSPLQLMAAGRIDKQAFTLIGRLQYRYSGGHWTEWIAAFDGSGLEAVLAEDNGAYAFLQPLEPSVALPPPSALRLGATTAINGQSYTVTSHEQVALVSAQGELSHLPPLEREFTAVELRSPQGTILSLNYDSVPPTAWLGRSVQLDDLQLTGLRDDADKKEKGRHFACPNCGAPVSVQLADSQSITCSACNSIIDLKAGIGGELYHAEQSEPVRPMIERGSVGQMQGIDWQVVGFQHRMGVEPGDDEHFGWNEYLLFNRKRGFSFLVDSDDGWSLVKPTTGAPKLDEAAKTATYLGSTYRQLYAYDAETTYVAGEFYWRVERGAKSFNRDFAKGRSLLSMERSKNEIAWSSGLKVGSADVAKAFKLDANQAMFKRSDAAPLSGGKMGCSGVIVMLVVLFVILFMLSMCSGGSGGGRSSGGSYGGYSSGGFHK